MLYILERPNRTSAPESTAGFGLGLPISKKFTDLMGGDLTLTSKEAEGSVFTLKIPRTEN